MRSNKILGKEEQIYEIADQFLNDNISVEYVHKVKDHGEVHGLEYTAKANGGTCCKKSEENVDQFMQSIASMPNRKNVKWFNNGTYQGGTERGYPAVHISEKDKREGKFW
jgi:hypothetical protein